MAFRGLFWWLSAENWREHLLDRGWSERNAALFEHYWRLNIEQIAAVIPITLLLVTCMAVFFGRTVDSPSEIAVGMIFAISGLSLFVDALRVVVMPLSEQLGTDLPRTLGLPAVLCITGILGVLVTYAEPAITSLRPLARLVDPYVLSPFRLPRPCQVPRARAMRLALNRVGAEKVAPYLYCALMQRQELLVLCIGLGVGVAAMLGTLRFVRGWSLKPLIVIVLIPTLSCAAYMWFRPAPDASFSMWGDEELRPLLGLAFDCGAVTTGPVTVPVLLALGIGVMKTQNERKAAEERAKNESDRELGGHEVAAAAAQDALEGFGIVTLASLLPVLSVELFSIGIRATTEKEDILANIINVSEVDGQFLETTPWREIYFALRAILPLNIILVFLVAGVLRKPLPTFTYYLAEIPPMSAPKTFHRTESGNERKSRTSLDGIRRSFGSRPSGEMGEGGRMRGSFEVVRGIIRTSRSFSTEIRKSFNYLRQKAFGSAAERANKGSLAVWGNFMQGVTTVTAAKAEGIPVNLDAGGATSSPGKRLPDLREKGQALATEQLRAEAPGGPREAAGDIEMLEAAFTGELQAGGAKRGSVDATGIGLLVEGGGGQGAVPAAVDATLADPRALSKVVAEAPHGASPNSLPSSRLNPVKKSASIIFDARTDDISNLGHSHSGGDSPLGSGPQRPRTGGRSISFHESTDLSGSRARKARAPGQDDCTVDRTPSSDRQSVDLLRDKPGGQGPAPPAAVLHQGARSPEANSTITPPALNDSSVDKRWSITVLLLGIFQAQVGMICFNLGLHFGFTSLGDQVGMLLPAAFLETKDVEDSPLYPQAGGVAIALGTMFTLGVFATRAEPALNVVGETVEKLTRGSFSKNMLVYSVCLGVGIGMTVGSTKILFKAEIIWFILFKYLVALCLTAFTKEDFINIAWDSAGVTTGPVTVPFVLSIGVGCSKAVRAEEGFGILACASVWPIITVLLVDGIRRAYARWAESRKPEPQALPTACDDSLTRNHLTPTPPA